MWTEYHVRDFQEYKKKVTPKDPQTAVMSSELAKCGPFSLKLHKDDDHDDDGDDVDDDLKLKSNEEYWQQMLNYKKKFRSIGQITKQTLKY